MAKLKREHARRRGKDSLELIEEAISLLRSAPSSHLAWYLIGTLPFVLAALYFWADMSRSRFADQRLIQEAFVLSCLFLWMKTCQAVFCLRMRSLVSGEGFTIGIARAWRIFLSQTAIQPSGLLLLPLALVLTLPFPWVFAFYQNVSVLDDGDTLNLRGLTRKASRQAVLWPAQNHCLLGIISVFGFFVFVNLATVCFLLPGLVKMLFGFETAFTRSGLSLLNTTFFAAVFGLTYICIDPIVRTIYALRCFYGESQRTGADLKSELRRFSILTAASTPLSILLLALAFLSSVVVAGEQAPAKQASSPADISSEQRKLLSSVSPAELDRVIQETVQQPKYAWREPRIKAGEADDDQKGFFARMFQRFRPFLIDSLKTIGRWLDALLKRLFFRQRAVGTDEIAGRWVLFLNVLLYALIAATAAGLVWLLYRIWKHRHAKPTTISGVPLQPAPDLSDENLAADQMPEDSWIKLARELLAKGELRLALRAFYLGSLAQLAAGNLIHLARFKSNRDYEHELNRRAHAVPDLIVAFGENLSVFDRVWYGLHEINRDIVNRFAENVERMRVDAAAPHPQRAQ